MAKPVGLILRYTPAELPAGASLETLAGHIQDELWRLAQLLDVVVDGFLEESKAPPAKLRNGMIRLADGTSWNPGAGRGVYWYDGNAAAWKFMG